MSLVEQILTAGAVSALIWWGVMYMTADRYKDHPWGGLVFFTIAAVILVFGD